ncbi:glutamine amidotransferase [Streptomyces griseoaurantiacus]|uniref:glutamine amidotransferase n=1 Tax=Streptomyces griseoaurantiacus TaxID=68213 RepID=UPI0036BE0BDB
MSRTALVVRHVAFEDLGILGPLLKEHGYRVRYLEAGVDRIGDDLVVTADLLIVLGGPVGVGDFARYPYLADEAAAVKARAHRMLPTIGICLGAQILAHALGAQVAPTGRCEIGYGPLTLTAEGEGSVLAGLGGRPVLHWHSDQFAVPEGATLLAGTPGFPHQAFTVGDTLLGLQFHLEADHTRLERWLLGHTHELTSHGVDLDRIRADADRYGAELASRARTVFVDWLRRALPVEPDGA